MRICYFGTYEKDYPRNRVVIEGLKRSGMEVVECHYPLWEKDPHKTGSFLSAMNLVRLCFRLLFGYLYLSCLFLRTGKYDVLMVGYIGQVDVFLAKALNLFHRAPVVFNPLVSLYDTLVLDREIFQQKSIIAKVLFYLDKWSMQLSDIVILDTNAHIEYTAGLFQVKPEKFMRIFVGADERLFKPRKARVRQEGLFRVLFYGKFIPLHGIHHILNAAKALEGDPEIRFQIIGKGQLSDETEALARRLVLKNIEFIEWVPYERLPETIAMADVCLGIFGDTPKTGRVIPNKVFQCLAMGKPVITSDSPAVRELLTDRVHALLCAPPFSDSLPQGLLKLKAEKDLHRELSDNGVRLFQEKLRMHGLVSGLVEVLESRVKGQPCHVKL